MEETLLLWVCLFAVIFSFSIFDRGDNRKGTKAMSQIENTSGDQQHQGSSTVSRPVYPPPPPYFALASAKGKLEPPPPIVGEYPLFGEVYTTEDGIPGLNVRRLYDVQPDGSVADVKKELLKLHEELKLNIMELLDVLIERPSAYGRQVENVGLVLRNMMHLTNRLRPIQAEMAAIAALISEERHNQLAVQNLKEATQQGKEALKKVLDVLKAGENEQMVE